MTVKRPPVLSVTQLNTYARTILEQDPVLKNVFVAGEISNFKNHIKTGHFYMTLKDENAAIKAVMFRSYASRLRFVPEDGMNVLCRGRVSVFDRDGAYQLYIEDMQPDGAGSLSVAFEQLKKKLSEKGLFDEKFKKPIPKYPSKIAVITSPTGAALQDILNILSRRWPLCEVVVVPSSVQGRSAQGELVRAVKKADSLCADTVIIGRGGGSVEDLWAFNGEELARAIFECKTPVISANVRNQALPHIPHLGSAAIGNQSQVLPDLNLPHAQRSRQSRCRNVRRTVCRQRLQIGQVAGEPLQYRFGNFLRFHGPSPLFSSSKPDYYTTKAPHLQ